MCVRTQSKTGEDRGDGPARYLPFTLRVVEGAPATRNDANVRLFFFSLSAMGLTRPKLQASPLCASPLKRAKRSCCVRARKPKTRRTATARTSKSSSRIYRNQLKAFLNPERPPVEENDMSLTSIALIESDI